MLPALEAAHLVPYSLGGAHAVPNGLLLRADVPKLFDKGYLGVDSDFRFRVSPLLRETFGNGDEFYAIEGREIGRPQNTADWPDRDALHWHQHWVFRAA